MSNNCVTCELVKNIPINEEYFVLEFYWQGCAPKAGQFFMMKPSRSSVFLLRPISIFEYDAKTKLLKFLIAKRGKGTCELSELQKGDKVIFTGSFGNAWADFLPKSSKTAKAALVGGSVGTAPLSSLVAEKPEVCFHFYAGFRQGFPGKDQENLMLGAAVNAKKLVVTAEDGKNAQIGRVLDTFTPENYDVVFGCGPIPMLKALKIKCESQNIPCFISMESRFACGVGACLGCTIRTVGGNRCCCKDGPIFPANTILFDE
ncbi:MAG: dihydroorotate dehydrogenase electron transfer subunit [Treponema sp.]|nr:dihydroorotate dehydrogenase electron transfer subunit [Treponema sp.]